MSPICFDRSECARYAHTLCLGCALALVRVYSRTGGRVWPPHFASPSASRREFAASTHPTAWVGDVPG
ncbi:hypothetical protein SLI_4932 [Streptomyces lividans 1326]|uniref:Uncharacterized protein n=1 Tax=Streptomyces lividans 1326 TaxID=1200984 RepID=A0A7U9DW83_STRLI|nr:hypothetical protein SLI_4932 [Streptomyces lividans 1326]